MMTAIFIFGTIGLLLGILMVLLQVVKEQMWLRAVIVPWMVNISRIVNPDKK